MIAMDTNVLVRFLLTDPECPRQSDAARSLVAKACVEEGVFLPTTVLVETVWVLQSRYRVPKPAISANLRRLLSYDGIVVDRRGVADQ